MGENLAQHWAGASPKRRLPVFEELDYDGRRWRAVIAGRYKLMLHLNDGQSFLFDLRNDPGEVRNLSNELESVRRNDLATLDRVNRLLVRRRLREPNDLSTKPTDEELQNLRALGYVQ